MWGRKLYVNALSITCLYMPGIMQKIKTSEFQSSTKIEALLQELCPQLASCGPSAAKLGSGKEIQKMQQADPTSKAGGNACSAKSQSGLGALLQALVFSQFSRFLELIEWRLKREGISAATVLGSMPIVSRTPLVLGLGFCISFLSLA